MVLLAFSAAIAKESRSNKGLQALNTVASTVGTFCAIQETVTNSVGMLAGFLFPQNSEIRVYKLLKSGKRVDITKQVVAIKNSICPALIGVTNRFR